MPNKNPNDFSWGSVSKLFAERDLATRQRRLESWLGAGWNPMAPQPCGRRAIRRIATDAWALTAVSRWAGPSQGLAWARASGIGEPGDRFMEPFCSYFPWSLRRGGEIAPDLAAPVRWLFDSLGENEAAAGPSSTPIGLSMLGSYWSAREAERLIGDGAPPLWFGSNDPAALSASLLSIAAQGDLDERVGILGRGAGKDAVLRALAMLAPRPKDDPRWTTWFAIAQLGRVKMARAGVAMGHRPDWSLPRQIEFGKDSSRALRVGPGIANAYCEHAPWEMAEKAATERGSLHWAGQLMGLWRRPDCGADSAPPPALQSILDSLAQSLANDPRKAPLLDEALAMCQAQHLRALVAARPGARGPSGPRL